ncbi:substrate-binding periplasmic protein [Kordiimonas aestuarii]|uniref:substrate-binding periplasmic protein n=1 Tax=Kordiimonas aestuarii TaxID=1005925 RepID=UPI0021CED3A7|nr:transporter substrate-binding domain-containing protein [Kordiimonas aestuarii]
MRCFVIGLVLLCVATGPLAAQGNTVMLTAAEWPPYSSAEMPGQGIFIEVARRTLARAGYKLNVNFSVWQRSLVTAMEGAHYIGTLPVYKNDERESICAFSKLVTRSPVGFVQRRGDPVTWVKSMDLVGLRIGAVSGYLNAVEFDRLAKEQVLDVSYVHTDHLNVRRAA